MGSSHFHPPNQLATTSAILLERVSQKDPEAWQRLVSLYAPVVRYWIRRGGLSGDELRDVFQETFVAVSRNMGRFQRESGVARFRGWLKTITASKVNDHYRRRAKHPVGPGGTDAFQQLGRLRDTAHQPGDEEDAALAPSDETFLVQRTLGIVRKEFRERTWKSFQRTAMDGLNAKEVAEELGMTPLAVRKAKSRVMQRLKEALASHVDRTEAQ